MTIDDILPPLIEKISEIVREQVTADDPLISSAVLTSFDVFGLESWLEKTYHIEFGVSDLTVNHGDTARQIAALVCCKIERA